VTPEEKILMNKLCAAIADEKDSQRFAELVKQLDELLERKTQRLEHPGNLPATPNSQ
jgi:hypothetical protein